MQEHLITGPHVTVEVVAKEKPVRAGVDPYNKLVDRNSADNLARVRAALSPLP